jgi:hypothetical protein
MTEPPIDHGDTVSVANRCDILYDAMYKVRDPDSYYSDIVRPASDCGPPRGKDRCCGAAR